MKITVSSVEGVYNRATREMDYIETSEGFAVVPVEVEKQLRKLAREYRTNVADMVALCLRYYFGDGKNHLSCEHCDWCGDGCGFPEVGEQTTIPVLDKGMVVVGLPSIDLGE